MIVASKLKTHAYVLCLLSLFLLLEAQNVLFSNFQTVDARIQFKKKSELEAADNTTGLYLSSDDSSEGNSTSGGKDTLPTIDSKFIKRNPVNLTSSQMLKLRGKLTRKGSCGQSTTTTSPKTGLERALGATKGLASHNADGTDGAEAEQQAITTRVLDATNRKHFPDSADAIRSTTAQKEVITFPPARPNYSLQSSNVLRNRKAFSYEPTAQEKMKITKQRDLEKMKITKQRSEDSLASLDGSDAESTTQSGSYVKLRNLSSAEKIRMEDNAISQLNENSLNALEDSDMSHLSKWEVSGAHKAEHDVLPKTPFFREFVREMSEQSQEMSECHEDPLEQTQRLTHRDRAKFMAMLKSGEDEQTGSISVDVERKEEGGKTRNATGTKDAQQFSRSESKSLNDASSLGIGEDDWEFIERVPRLKLVTQDSEVSTASGFTTSSGYTISSAASPGGMSVTTPSPKAEFGQGKSSIHKRGAALQHSAVSQLQSLGSTSSQRVSFNSLPSKSGLFFKGKGKELLDPRGSRCTAERRKTDSSYYEKSKRAMHNQKKNRCVHAGTGDMECDKCWKARKPLCRPFSRQPDGVPAVLLPRTNSKERLSPVTPTSPVPLGDYGRDGISTTATKTSSSSSLGTSTGSGQYHDKDVDRSASTSRKGSLGDFHRKKKAASRARSGDGKREIVPVGTMPKSTMSVFAGFHPDFTGTIPQHVSQRLDLTNIQDAASPGERRWQVNQMESLAIGDSSGDGARTSSTKSHSEPFSPIAKLNPDGTISNASSADGHRQKRGKTVMPSIKKTTSTKSSASSDQPANIVYSSQFNTREDIRNYAANAMKGRVLVSPIDRKYGKPSKANTRTIQTHRNRKSKLQDGPDSGSTSRKIVPPRVGLGRRVGVKGHRGLLNEKYRTHARRLYEDMVLVQNSDSNFKVEGQYANLHARKDSIEGTNLQDGFGCDSMSSIALQSQESQDSSYMSAAESAAGKSKLERAQSDDPKIGARRRTSKSKRDRDAIGLRRSRSSPQAMSEKKEIFRSEEGDMVEYCESSGDDGKYDDGIAADANDSEVSEWLDGDGAD